MEKKPTSNEENKAREAVFVETKDAGAYLGDEVKGYDFATPDVDFKALLNAYRTTGFQATNFGKAIEEINKMVQ
jgi:deoxyhypusine synthase